MKPAVFPKHIFKTKFKYSLKEHRNFVSLLEPDIPPADVLNFNIQVKINHLKSNIRLYQPANLHGVDKHPAIFYIPGNGFVADENFSHMICSHIANISNSLVFQLPVLLSPEHPAPVALNALYSLFQFLRMHSDNYGIDTDKIVLMGYSSGAYFASLIALKAAKDKIAISQRVLVSPLVDLLRSNIDYQEIEDLDRTVKEPFVRWTINHYLAKSSYLPDDPEISPQHADFSVLKYQRVRLIHGNRDRVYGDNMYLSNVLMKNNVYLDHVKYTGDHGFFWWDFSSIERIAYKITIDLGYVKIPRSLIPKRTLKCSEKKNEACKYMLRRLFSQALASKAPLLEFDLELKDNSPRCH